MKYEIGKTFYKLDDKGNTKKIEVVDIKYKLTGIQHKYLNEEELEDYIEDNGLVTDEEEIKKLRIKRLEEEFNIKLKEV